MFAGAPKPQIIRKVTYVKVPAGGKKLKPGALTTTNAQHHKSPTKVPSTPADAERTRRHANLENLAAAKSDNAPAGKAKNSIVQESKKDSEVKKPSETTNNRPLLQTKGPSTKSNPIKPATNNSTAQSPKEALKQQKISEPPRPRFDSKLGSSATSSTCSQGDQNAADRSTCHAPSKRPNFRKPTKASKRKLQPPHTTYDQDNNRHAIRSNELLPPNPVDNLPSTTSNLRYTLLQTSFRNEHTRKMLGQITNITTPTSSFLRLQYSKYVGGRKTPRLVFDGFKYMTLETRNGTSGHKFVFRSAPQSKVSLPATMDDLKNSKNPTGAFLGTCEYASLRVVDPKTRKTEEVHALEVIFTARGDKRLCRGFIYGEDPSIPVGQGRFIDADASIIVPDVLRRKRVRDDSESEWDVTLGPRQKKKKVDPPIVPKPTPTTRRKRPCIDDDSDDDHPAKAFQKPVSIEKLTSSTTTADRVRRLRDEEDREAPLTAQPPQKKIKTSTPGIVFAEPGTTLIPPGSPLPMSEPASTSSPALKRKRDIEMGNDLAKCLKR